MVVPWEVAEDERVDVVVVNDEIAVEEVEDGEEGRRFSRGLHKQMITQGSQHGKSY